MAVPGVYVQLPLLSATTSIAAPPSMTMWTVAPASAVPLKVGVLSPVVEPFAGVETTGALGATVSTVTAVPLELGLVLPATSVWVAL